MYWLPLSKEAKKSKKAAAKKQKKAKKKPPAPARAAPAPAPEEDDDVDEDSDDEVEQEAEPVKEVVKKAEPAPVVLSKKAKKKAKAKAAATPVEKEPEAKSKKIDLNTLLPKEKPAEAVPAPVSGKKKKKKKGAVAVTAEVSAPALKERKPVEEELVTEENNDDEWVTIQSSSSKRKKRQAEELKAVAAANAASGWVEGNDGEEAVAQGPPQVTVTIKLGSSAGFVIGRGGSRVQALQEETGAHIDIQKDSNKNEAKITGTQEAVDWAHGEIQRILDERAFEDSKIEAFIPIGEDPTAVRKLIGRGGGNIRYIQEMTGIKVDVQEDDGRIRLFGMPDDMDYAKELAAQALDGLNIQAGPQSLRNLTLDDQGVITFIGRGGDTIRRFNADFPSCTFDVDKTKNTIRVSAPTDSDVDAAIDAINKLLQDSNFTDMIDISDCTGAVIGKGGETIKRIQQESGARLDIEKEDYGTFLKVTGMPEDVQRAREEVERVRNAPPLKKQLRDGEVDFEVELGGASSAVIGRKGVKINSIQKESGAKLDIGRGSSSCRIMGTPEAVEKAKVLVLVVKAEWDERNKPAEKEDEDNAFAVTEDVPVASVTDGPNWQQAASAAEETTTESKGWGTAPVEVEQKDTADQGWGADPAATEASGWGGGSGW